jgi:hypothetical protein
LPGGVVELSRNKKTGEAVVLGTSCSWIDWGDFQVCVAREGAAESCARTSLPSRPAGDMVDSAAGPGMPMLGNNPLRMAMTLRVTLRPNAQCPRTSIYMPRLARVCPGIISAVTGGRAEVSTDRRWARMTGDDAPTEIALQWQLGEGACLSDYQGEPPFFLEGATDVVEALAPMLEPSPGEPPMTPQVPGPPPGP